MQSQLNPYLSFRGNAREAIHFYQSVFGGEVSMSTYKDGGMPHDPAESEFLMHAHLQAPNGITIMASDTPKSMEHHQGTSITLSLNGDNDEELSGYFAKLAEGGSVQEPLVTAPWGDKFGMLTDKFGLYWMVNITPKA